MTAISALRQTKIFHTHKPWNALHFFRTALLHFRCIFSFLIFRLNVQKRCICFFEVKKKIRYFFPPTICVFFCTNEIFCNHRGWLVGGALLSVHIGVMHFGEYNVRKIVVTIMMIMIICRALQSNINLYFINYRALSNAIYRYL